MYNFGACLVEVVLHTNHTNQDDDGMLQELLVVSLTDKMARLYEQNTKNMLANYVFEKNLISNTFWHVLRGRKKGVYCPRYLII